MDDLRSFLKSPDCAALDTLKKRLQILGMRREIILSNSRIGHVEPTFLAFVKAQLTVFDDAIMRLSALLETTPLTEMQVREAEELSYVAEDIMTILFQSNDAYIKESSNKTKVWFEYISIGVVVLLSFLFILFGSISMLWRKTLRQGVILRGQALRDGLTGLYNRRYFDEVSGPLIESAVRSRASLCLLMIDVDHFKRYNDTYGHDSGDVVLARIGSMLRETAARKGDLVFRLGGEEFCCLVTTQDETGAVHVAERIRAAMEDCAIPHVTSSVTQVVTVSVGVACLRPPYLISRSQLYAAADKALYMAKNAGRNRVHVCTTH